MKKTLDTSSTTTTNFDPWSEPIRVEVNEYLESIEMIYVQTSMVTLTIHPSPPPEERVFKIEFSVVKGKWHKSERIYGIITPSRGKSYSFET